MRNSHFSFYKEPTLFQRMYILSYTFPRLAFKGHDVNWSKKKDPVEPMSTLENKQFKMFNVSGFDYSNASAPHIEANKYRD